MKLFVLGCNGMVGHVVSLYLQERGHQVSGYDETPSPLLACKTGSLYDRNQIAQCLEDGRYDGVINCTAVVNQDAEADKAQASYVNTYLPHYLESLTAGTETIVVHRSTDCIFSGKHGPYRQESLPDATSFYARSKALGELVNEKDITIRTSLIGPEQTKNGTSLLNWFINQSGEVSGFANSKWTGLTTIEFAREIESLLTQRAHGVLQCVPSHAISKYELLRLFEKTFPGDRTVKRVDNPAVNKALEQTLGSFQIRVPDYEPMIGEMADWVAKHKNLYLYY